MDEHQERILEEIEAHIRVTANYVNWLRVEMNVLDDYRDVKRFLNLLEQLK